MVVSVSPLRRRSSIQDLTEFWRLRSISEGVWSGSGGDGGFSRNSPRLITFMGFFIICSLDAENTRIFKLFY